MKLFGGMWCVTRNNWLDCDGDVGRVAETGILKEFLPLQNRGSFVT